MRARAKRVAVWSVGFVLLFVAGLLMGKARPSVSAQTEVLVQGRYLFIDKSTASNPRNYLMFDTQGGVLMEWTEDPDSTVFTYEFSSPRDIRLSTTTIRR